MGAAVSTMATRPQRASAWKLIRTGWERIAIYLPIILMGLLAMGTYWLARNTPAVDVPGTQTAPSHDPDYSMRGFSVKTFDAGGRLKTEVYGTEARHYPDTDTLEIDQPRIRAFNERGELTLATAQRALSNADGSEVQLIGDAVVTREAVTDAAGHTRPRLEFRGEFLHAFLNVERVKSHKPVALTRGDDKFTAENMDFDNIAQVMTLHGRVSGVLIPRAR